MGRDGERPPHPFKVVAVANDAGFQVCEFDTGDAGVSKLLKR
jgi:hypothetical protein